MDKEGSLVINKSIVISLGVVFIFIFFLGLGQYDALLDNVKYQWNEMAYLVSSVLDYGERVCSDGDVSELGGGKRLLKELGVDDAVFYACRDGVCEFEWDGGKFELENGDLYKVDDKNRFDWSFVQKIDISADKGDWRRYNEAVVFLKDRGLYELFEKMLTRRFVLYGNGAGIGDDAVYMIWQSGEWAFETEGKEPVYNESDDEAISVFIKEVDDWWDDEVSWGVDDRVVSMDDVYVSADIDIAGLTLDEACRKICEYAYGSSEYGYDAEHVCSGHVRNNNMCCCHEEEDVFQLMGEREFDGDFISLLVGSEYGMSVLRYKKDRLRSGFGKIKEELMGEVSFYVKSLGSLVGERVEIDGRDYVVSVDNSSDFPVVVFSSDEDKFGLRVGAFPDLYSRYFDGEQLVYDPIYLVKLDGEMWKKVRDEDFYRLSEERMLDIYRADLIDGFLKSKCR